MDSVEVTLTNKDEEITKKIGPLQRVGYCKFKSQCKNIHSNEDCDDWKCTDKILIKNREEIVDLEKHAPELKSVK